MPLSLNSLISGLNNMPEDADSPADSIGLEITKYTAGIIPVVNPVAKEAADSIFLTSLSAISFDTNFDAIFLSAINIYVASLALGMQPLFTGTPPVVPLVISDITSIYQSKQNFSNSIGSRIDSWFRTGTAVNNATGVLINWN